jgi:hypothetical protein
MSSYRCETDRIKGIAQGTIGRMQLVVRLALGW